MMKMVMKFQMMSRKKRRKIKTNIFQSSKLIFIQTQSYCFEELMHSSREKQRSLRSILEYDMEMLTLNED
jgi:hypothetical protein